MNATKKPIALVYARPRIIIDNSLPGLEAVGFRAQERNPNPFNKVGEMEEAALVVAWGYKYRGREVIDAYEERGTPSFVVDLGYYGREEGYHQIGRGGLNKVTPHDCPSDRAEAIDLVAPRTGKKRKGYALVLLQAPGDAQLGQDYQEWIDLKLKELEVGGYDVKVRPHPIVQESETTIVDDLAGAEFVVCYNSNGALEAFVEGVPVYCHESAHYVDAAQASQKGDQKTVQAHLNRVAYSQWTLEEMADGTAWKMILERERQDEPEKQDLKREAAQDLEPEQEPEPQAAAPINYNDMSHAGLRALCKVRDLKANGKTAELIERLEEADRNEP